MHSLCQDVLEMAHSIDIYVCYRYEQMEANKLSTCIYVLCGRVSDMMAGCMKSTGIKTC